MAQKTQNYIYIDHSGGIIFFEFILIAVVAAIFSVALLEWPWSIGIVLFIVYVIALDRLFSNVWLLRWIFSTGMSAGWGYFVFFMTRHFVGTNINTYIMGILAFLFMLFVHKDEYHFNKSANVILFEYHGRD